MQKVSPEEWTLRCDLAAAFRLLAHFGMDDLIYTHLSARLPGEECRFLINPFGMMFDEITASSLVAVNADGYACGDEDACMISTTAFTIHSAVQKARTDAHCVMHTHTLGVMTVAAQEGGLLPLSQMAMEFYGNVAYHSYEGFAFHLEERERLVRDFADKDVMILRNHGLLTVGRTIAEAFYNAYYLELACRIQVAATNGSQKPLLPPREVVEHTATQAYSLSATRGQRVWTALRRRLDRISPDYRQ